MSASAGASEAPATPVSVPAFGAAQAYSAGPGAGRIVAADLDGDGRFDLATANYGLDVPWPQPRHGGMSALLGDGAGGLSAPNTYEFGVTSRAIAAGDFDGDGRADLAVGDYDEGQVRIWLGDGTGRFAHVGTRNLPSQFSAFWLETGDFDGDGRLDLASANYFPNSVSVFLGDGTGGFGARADYAVGRRPTSLAVGDFNNDGRPDIVATNRDSNTVSLLLGGAGGAFGAARNVATGGGPHEVRAADLDGDGDLDLAVSNSGDGTVSVLLGDGAGAFSASTVTVGAGPQSLAAADLDGDGALDLAVGRGAEVSLFVGNGSGGFVSGGSVSLPGAHNLVAVDLNGDGRVDLASTDGEDDGKVWVALQLVPGVVTNTNDGGPGSLRAAIDYANANPGPDTISFAIPPTDPGFNGRWFTIRPLSALPELRDGGTTIDGTTQTTFTGDTNGAGPEVELRGDLAGATGLAILTSDSTVTGLAINSFSTRVLEIQGSRNVISRSYIGTDAAGTITGNVGNGIFICCSSSSRENRVVGNLLSGNRPGMILHEVDASVVQGNQILNSGPQPAPPGCGQGAGIFVSGNGNLIGGSGPGEGNVISGNGNAGIALQGGNGTAVVGNFIGTDATGALAHGNHCLGIALEGSPNDNTVIRGNVVSGNGTGGIGVGNGVGTQIQGNRIGTNADGTAGIANGGSGVFILSSSVTIGGPAAGDGNLISGNAGGGVQVCGGLGCTASGIVVQGNRIGTNAAGTAAIRNFSGVVMFNTSSSRIAGNVISGGGDGIHLKPGTSGITVVGNRLGTTADGSAALGNLFGIQIAGVGHVIGGATPSERNVIAGSTLAGVAINAGAGPAQVVGNYIGTDATGTVALPNGTGVGVSASGATISGNLISGNRGSGIAASGGPGAPTVNGLAIRGNLIGTDASGTSAVPNGDSGISFIPNGVNDAVVQGNRIQFNGTQTGTCGSGPGMFVRGDDNLIGGTGPGQGNVVSGNGNAGIALEGGDRNVIQGNLIGTDATGSAAIGNHCMGIALEGALNSNTLIGGTSPAARNVVSGNGQGGIAIVVATSTVVQGNYIGTNADGTAPIANHGVGAFPGAGAGVLIRTSSVTVGGAASGAGNVISGNSGSGISAAAFGPGSPLAGITVAGNRIGTNAGGTSAIPNGSVGVQFSAVASSAIRDNLISGNAGFGVGFFGGSTGSSGNTIAGNLIGTDASGSTSVPNGGGISFFAGALAGSVTDNVIGGTAAGARNVISGNGGAAISFAGSANVAGNTIRGNYVGVAADGSTPLGNGLGNAGSFAIGFFAPTAAGPSGNRVEANVIAYNQGGVVVGAGKRNAVIRNRIFGNAGLGIDLVGGGVTPNDEGDADTGPNELMNFPVLRQAIMSPGRTVVVGFIDTPSPQTVTIELFANTAGDPSGHGEGETFLGAARPNASGNFVAVLPPRAAGTFITATATDAAGNTSEFAANVVAR